MPGCQFSHFSRAHQIDSFALERTKNLLRQLHRDGGNRDTRPSHRGFRAHTLGYGEGAREQRLKTGVDCAESAGYGIRLFYLAENLRFANDHGIETRVHATTVTHRTPLLEFVELRVD